MALEGDQCFLRTPPEAAAPSLTQRRPSRDLRIATGSAFVSASAPRSATFRPPPKDEQKNTGSSSTFETSYITGL